ncbi:LamG-like jellyroll fold domain-containing protein [Hamadaea tsunoensis]|uniref:LamG-like jellyroll fold domain-containing protein n=1 Tax=Hamadaea tsunoensis TaxID=53368 RepID=UPI0012F8D1AC|nr:LamG-like jellyroll fold domain-containing protein [Hamadaea tsunoensis]
MAFLGLSVGVPTDAIPAGGHFPLGWAASWITNGRAWAAFSGGPAPAQPTGRNLGLAGQVPASATRAGGGHKNPQHKAAGGLDGYQPYTSPPATAAPSVRGFDAKTSRRDARNSRSTMDQFTNADGSVTRRVYGGPVNYRAADGTWQPISTDLVRVNGRWATKANSLRVSFTGTTTEATAGTTADAAAGHLVSMTLPSGEVFAYDLKDAKLGTPSVAGAKATYAAVFPHTNLELEGSADGVQETLVLDSPAAGNSWVFPLALRGLTARMAADGSIELVDASGKVAGQLPKGSMRDSHFDRESGDMTHSPDVVYELVDGGTAVRVTADAAWLADPARVYPVRVDPTVTTGTTGDVYVDNDSGTDASDQNGDNLPVGTYNGGTVKARSFIALGDFGGDVTGKRITAATLNLHLTWTYSCTVDRAFTVWANAASWSVANLSTSGLYGPAQGAQMASYTVTDPGLACTNTGADRSVGPWIHVPITNIAPLIDWQSGGPNYGIGLTASETDSNGWKRFTAANYSAGAYKATLDMTYTTNVAPQVDTTYPANNTIMESLTPQLVVRAHDPDKYPNKPLAYSFAVYTPDNLTTAVATSGWVNSTTWTVPAGKLKWNGTYVWRVVPSDYVTMGTWTPYMAFTTPVPQPVLTSTLAQNPGKGYDPGSGNYTTTATDASLPGPGPALDVTRSYNSLSRATDTAFGMGWSSMLDMRARQNLDVSGAVKTVSVRYPSGQEVAFGRNSDGTFTPPSGRYALFSPLLSGTTVIGYTLTDKDATVYKFGQPDGTGTAWKVTSVTDANGRTETFTYDASNLLTTVTGASGRALHVEWSTPAGANRKYVSKITTDPAVAGDSSTALSWTYNMNYVQLMGVCGPAAGGGCTNYEYQWYSQGANAVLNTGPYAFWRLNEASGDIARSGVLANAGVDNALYKNVGLGGPSLYGTTSASSGFNGTSSFVQLPGKLVTDGAYQSIGLWFKTTTAGGVLFSYNHDPVTSGTTAGNYTPALYIDQNGFLRGELWTGTPTPIKSGSTVTDGTWHYAVLAGAGSTQTLYVDGVAQGSLAGTIAMVDATGSMNDVIGAGFVGHGWPDHARTGASPAVATYFTGQISDVAYFTKAVTSAEVQAMWDAGRWSSTELSKITRPSGRVSAAVTYDSATANVTKVVDDDGGSWTLNPPSIVGDSDVYEASVLGGKPLGYWRLAETGTTDAVNEVNGDVATYTDVTLGATGPFSDATAGAFNGTTSSVALPAGLSPAAGNSVDLWFNTTHGGGILATGQAGALGDTMCPCEPSLWIGTDGKLRGLAPSSTPTGPLTSDGIAGKCVDVEQGGTANGTHIQLYTCNGTAPQNWTFMADGTLRAVGKCLDVPGGATASGTKLQLYDCNAGVAQRWEPFGNGLRNPNSGKCIDDPSSSTTNGTQLQIYVCNNTAAQAWTQELLSPAAVTDGKWHHAVIAASNNTQTLYLDGNAVGSSTGAVTFAPGAQPYAYLGAGFTGTGWSHLAANTTAYFNGSIAEAAFYGGQLSTADVQAQYAASKQTLPVVLTTVDTTVKTIPMPVKVVTVTDPGGNTLSYSYDMVNGNRVVAQSDALGNVTRFGYDTGGFTNLVYDPNGSLTQTVQDARGNSIQQITCQDQAAQDCSSTYYEYYLNTASATDPRNDLLVTTRDPRSGKAGDSTWDLFKTTNAYDAFGNPTTVTDPLGNTTSTAYTDGTTVAAFDAGYAPPGLPSVVTDQNGNQQKIVYYANGDIAKVTTAGGATTTFTYDKLGRKLSDTTVTSTFPAGRTETFTYDGLGRVLTQTNPATVNRVSGATHTARTTNVYDADGNMTTQTTADLTGGDVARTESVTFNALGQKDSQTDALGKTRSFAYDVYGHVIRETDPDGGATRYDVDAEGHILKTWMVGFVGDPDNPGTPTDKLLSSAQYDPAGRLATSTDAMGWTTRYTYTDNGLTAKVVREDGAGAQFVTEQNTYDKAGNVTRKVTANGDTTSDFAYDAAGRMIQSTLDPAGLNRVTQVGLAADGQSTSVVSRVGTAGTVLSAGRTAYAPSGGPMLTTAYNSDPQTTPVARWRLNETSGTTAADTSGGLAPATASGAVTPTANGAVFNGTSGWLAAPNPVIDTSQSYTVSAWVTLADKNANHPVVWKSFASTPFEMYYEKSSDRWTITTATFSWSPTWKAVRSSAAAQTGVATHLAAVYDAAAHTFKLYVNGVLDGTVTGVVNRQDVRGTFYIGQYGQGEFFAGTIKDVQAYQSALTDPQVAAVKGGTAPVAAASVTRTYSQADEEGLTTASADALGNVTNIEYDAAGRPTVSTGPAVNWQKYGSSGSARPATFVGYDTFGDRTETQDGNGNITTHVFDRAGREYETHLPAYTPPGSATPITPVTSSVFDTLGQPVSTTDALNHTTAYTYDQLGRVTKVTGPTGAVTRAAYDMAGQLLSATDATGAVSRSTYDYLGRKITSTQEVRQAADGPYVTTYAYDADGRLQSVKSPGNVTQSYTYNAAGETLTSTDGAGQTTTVTYDGLGRPVSTKSPDNTSSTTAYDMLGRPVGTADLSSTGTTLRTTSAGFDANGNLSWAKDARGTTTTLTYDPTGMVLTENQPIDATTSVSTSFGYDLAGNRTRFTNGRNVDFWTTFTPWNQPESTIEPAGSAYTALADRTYTTVYDAAGRVAAKNEPGGVSQTYTYDAAGRLTGQNGSGAEAATTGRTFGYDLAGRMTSFSAPTGTNTVAYDDRGLPTSITGPSGDATFAYDKDGRLVHRVDAAGTTDFTYDSAGRLATAKNGTAVDASFAYNSRSALSQITYGGTQNRRVFAYDDLHQVLSENLTKSDGTSIAKIDYGWDAGGNEISKKTTNFNGTTTANTYTYDLANRLTSWTAGTVTTPYAYDKAGNRTVNGNRTFVYDDQNRLVGDGATTYAYTARGTLASTQTGTTVLTSTDDAFDQVTAQQYAGGTQTYAYDALGRGLRTGFAYTGLDNDLAADSTATYVRDPGGGVLGEQSGGVTRLAWTDLHDDVVGQFTASSTALDASTTYDPLGRVTATTGMLGNLGYQSEWTDTFTSRVNMLARWYNTDTGQFDNRDSYANNPVPTSVSANRYAYADDNPLVHTDPSGHCSWWNAVCKAANAWNNSALGQTVNHTVSAAYNQAASYTYSAFNYGLSKVSSAAHSAGWTGLENLANKGRTYTAKKAEEHHRAYQVEKAKAKVAGHQLKQQVQRSVTKKLNKLKDAASKAKQWVKEHKDAIIEVAAIALTVVATVTLGPVGGLLVGIAINVAKDAAQGKIHSLSDFGKSLAVNAVSGTLGLVTGGIGGAVAGKLLCGVGAKVGTNLLGRMAVGAASGAISGGIGGGLTDIGMQVYNNWGTGKGIDWNSVKNSTISGAVMGGVMGAAGGARAKGCHSFDPSTRVVMADGTTRRIEDVKVGDKVKATDPATGKTEAKPVTVLHKNDDKDLADVTVKDTKSGKSTVLHTTWHHPFWNASQNRWTEAVDLQVGTHLRSADGETAQVVTGIKVWTGLKWMRDLTVQDIHTYYVLANNTPVLVHNTTACSPEPGPAPEGTTLRDYADANRGSNQAATPDFVTEYTSPSGKRYYGRTQGDTDIEPGSALDDVLGASHRRTCSEVCAMNEAQKAEGDTAIFGGSFSTLRVRPMGSPEPHGEPFNPCKQSCKTLIGKVYGSYDEVPGR